jgi:ribosomal protein S18 acetylase RimI-like enzyme
MTEFAIRPYHPSDLPAIYHICVRTADCGEDGSAGHEDPEILAHYFAGPYAVLEPDLCFILTTGGQACGYVLGTRDSDVFYRRCEAEWFPVLRERYPLPPQDDASPGAWIKRSVHEGIAPDPDAEGFPAHLHIDLLPQAVGQGNGRKLMDRFMDKLRELSVPGVHLGVARKNERAIAFYMKTGFRVLVEHDWGFLMGREL